ncbi:MAG: hypothetical protein EBY94_03035 [Burkholderiaceae bacterium]|nr:hypothetical protein [Burkholderiaceae bacterium]
MNLRQNRFWNISREGFDGFRSGLRDAVSGVEQTRSRMMEYDQLLVWAVLSLSLIGLVMVYSASITLADGPKYANYSSNHFLVRHLISLGIAVFVGFWVFKIPVKTWDKLAPYIFAFTILLLIAVLIPGIGKGVNGARRWISLGVMNFQPSELMKFAVIIFAASYTVQRQEYLHSFVKGFVPMGLAVALVGHTDFILAVIGEELGFIGVFVVILLFYWIVRRAFLIGRTALQLDRSFAGLCAKGVGIWIGWQAFINMGVNLGILPTKGLTLPLVSYGGSAILMNMVAFAVLLKIDYENRILMRGGKL